MNLDGSQSTPEGTKIRGTVSCPKTIPTETPRENWLSIERKDSTIVGYVVEALWYSLSVLYVLYLLKIV